MTPKEIEKNDSKIEKIVGELYSAFFRFNEAGLHQEAYDSMGVIMNMLAEDRNAMRLQGKVKHD